MDSNAVVLDISSDDESGSEDYKWISELLNGEVRENDDSDDVVVVVSEVMSTWNSKSDNDDDCVILDDDPDKPVSVVVDAASWSDELLVVGEKGKIACRDYPHPRHICAKFPFGTTPHETHCDQCHCYVCDSLAPCVYWKISNSIIDHCHATDKEETWKLERKNAKLGKSDSLPVLKLPHTSLSMNQVLPPVHYYSLPRNPVYRSTVISPCSSSSSSSSSRVLFGTMAQEKRFVGVVCWFNDAKGFGFITPSFGDEDLFVHQSAILSDGYRSLNQGDTVKFAIVDGNNGRKQAIDVTISDVSFIEINRKDRNSGGRRNNRRGSSYGGFNGGLRSSDRGRIGGESYSGGGDCFNCGEVGHMAWDCGNNVGVDGSGDGGVECNDFDQIGHISGDCRQENCSGGVTTVRTCYTCGQLGHMARKCTNGSGDRGSVGGGRDVGCYTCGQSGHVASDCTNVSGSGGACHNCGEIGHFWRDCHEERSSERYGGGFSSHGGVNSGSGGRACHNCGKIGHFSRECHEGRSSERYGGGFSSHGGFNSGGGGGGGGGACHNCGKIGHFSRDCHEERSSERYGRHSGGGRVCYYCGQEGHIARECPYIS